MWQIATALVFFIFNLVLKQSIYKSSETGKGDRWPCTHLPQRLYFHSFSIFLSSYSIYQDKDNKSARKRSGQWYKMALYFFLKKVPSYNRSSPWCLMVHVQISFNWTVCGMLLFGEDYAMWKYALALKRAEASRDWITTANLCSV